MVRFRHVLVGVIAVALLTACQETTSTSTPSPSPIAPTRSVNTSSYRVFLPIALNQRKPTIVGAETDGGYFYPDRKVYQGALGWARITSVDWWTYEAVSGTITLGGYAASMGDMFNDAISDGVTPMVVIRTVPAWASVYPEYRNGPIKPQHYIDFAEFVVAVIEYYPMVKYFELFNEPDAIVYDQYGYMGAWEDPIAYVDMLKVVYPYVKLRHPEVKIISGGIASSPADAWMVSAYGAGLTNFVDVVAYHSYQDTTSTVNQSHSRALALRNLVGNKPIMMNEGGLAQWDGVWSVALQQARIKYLEESIQYAREDGLIAWIWFRTQPWIWATGLTTNGAVNALGEALRKEALK